MYIIISLNNTCYYYYFYRIPTQIFLHFFYPYTSQVVSVLKTQANRRRIYNLYLILTRYYYIFINFIMYPKKKFFFLRSGPFLHLNKHSFVIYTLNSHKRKNERKDHSFSVVKTRIYKQEQIKGIYSS